MLFLGWFALDSGLVAHDPVRIGAFVIAVLVSFAVIGGYLGALSRKAKPSTLAATFSGLLMIVFSVLTVGSVVGSFRGNGSSLTSAVLLSLLAVFFGKSLRRYLAATKRQRPDNSPKPIPGNITPTAKAPGAPPGPPAQL